ACHRGIREHVLRVWPLLSLAECDDRASQRPARATAHETSFDAQPRAFRCSTPMRSDFWLRQEAVIRMRAASRGQLAWNLGEPEQRVQTPEANHFETSIRQKRAQLRWLVLVKLELRIVSGTGKRLAVGSHEQVATWLQHSGHLRERMPIASTQRHVL